MRDLKLMALESLGFEACVADVSRLRSGLHKGDGLLTKEALSISEAGLVEGAALTLEITSLPNDDVIPLRFCKVAGNDRGSKYNPLQPGVRSAEATLDVLGTEELSSVRERMLCFTEGFLPSPDTDMDTCHTRLRLTNWAGESGDLLEELDSESGAALTIHDAINSGLVKPGDLLLVEEGRVPIKGHLHVKVGALSPCRTISLGGLGVKVSYVIRIQLFLWRSDLTIRTSSDIVTATLTEDVRASFAALKASTNPPRELHPDRQAKADLLTTIGEVACHEDGLLTDFYESAYLAVKNFFESDMASGVSLSC